MVKTDKDSWIYFDEKILELLKKAATVLFLVIIVLSLINGSFFIISPGQRGVLLTFGEADKFARSEGLHFKIPYVQQVIKIDVKTQKYETGASSASKDLQIVSTDIAVNYHLVPESTPKLLTEIGLDYSNRVIQPAVQEVVKATTAQFTAEELITKRPEVKEKIKDLLAERLGIRDIVVEDISITNFDFSASFNNAIEEKVKAEQLKLKAERDLERIKIEKEQKITQAEAEAQSIKIQSTALRENKDILQLRAIEKWDGVLPKVTGGATPFVNIETLK